MNSKENGGWKVVLKIGVSVLVLSLLFRKCDWVMLAQTLRSVRLSLFLASFGIAMIAYLVGAYRWKLLCPKATTWVLFKLIFISRLYATILPGQLLGEASKVLYIGAQMKRRGVVILPEEATSSVVVDKMVGLIGLLLLGMAGVLLRYEAAKVNVLLAFILCLVGLVFLMAMPAIPSVARLCDKLLSRTKNRLPKATSAMRGCLSAWQGYLRQPKPLLLSLLLGIIFQLISVLSSMVCALSIGITIDFADWCWVVCALSLVLLLPISFAGLGVREATLVGFLAALGVSNETALGCSMLFLLTLLLEALIGGVFALQGKGIQKRKNRGGRIE